MDNRRDQRNSWRGRGSGRGGRDDGPVSSYASLATGPPPSYVERERGDDDYRGGGRGGRSRGRGRGRGRGGRGRGRGRGGRGSFRGGRDIENGGRDRDRYIDRGPDRSSPSRNSSNSIRGSSTAVGASDNTKSGDDSGYESGELSPSPPKPVMDPPRRMLSNPNDNFGSHRDGPPPRFTDDRSRDRDHPPFESRNRFPGGRGDYDDSGRGRGRGDFDGRGRGGRGRGRGRMGGGRFEVGRGRGRGGRGGRFFDDRGGREGGRSDFGGRGRGGERRESFRGMDDLSSRDSERDRPRDLPPRRDGPRDIPRDGPARDGPRDLSRRDEMFRDGPREPPRRDEMFRDGPRELPRRDEPFRDGPRDLPRRDEPFRDGPRELPRRDEPFRDGQREFPRRDEPFRDGPRELPRRDEQFRDGPRELPRRDESFRDGPRDFPRRDEPFRDEPREFPRRDEHFRDGPRELPRRDDEPRGFMNRDQPSRDEPRDFQRREGSRDLPHRNESRRDDQRHFLHNEGQSRDGPRDFPQRDGHQELQRQGSREFPRDLPRDAPREFLRRDENIRESPRDFARREESLRDGPREAMRRDGPRDFPRRDEMMRDGLREPPRDGHADGPRDLRDPGYSREDNRYQMHGRPPILSGSYRNILNETGSRIEQETGHDQNDDMFGKRGRDDRDFRASDRDEKRPRPNDHSPRENINRHIPSNDDRAFGSRDSYENKGKPLYNDRAPDNTIGRAGPGRNGPGAIPSQAEFQRSRDGPMGRKGGPPPREDSGSHEEAGAFRNDRDFYGRGPRPPLDITKDRGEGVPPRFGGRDFNDRAEDSSSDMNQRPPDNRSRSPVPFSTHRGPGSSARDEVRGRGRGRGGRGPFRGRGPGRSDFGRGDGDYGRNIPPPIRDRDGREPNSVPPYHRNEGPGWNRRPEDEGKHHNSAPVTKGRERETLPSFSSYGQMALNDPKPPTARTPGIATTNPGKLQGKADQAKQNADKRNADKRSGTDSTEAKKATEKEESKAAKPPPGPRAPSPPPKGRPTGAMLALARLLELEASMEYAYTKHVLLMQRQKELAAQYKVLETLPVGLEAIKEELETPRLEGASQGA